MKDYCQGESFRARCSYDEVIEMKSALYGRMELGRCVELDMGHIGCHADVLDLADDRCSGRRMCDISVPDMTFESTKPCLELKSYLRASYACIKGRLFISSGIAYLNDVIKCQSSKAPSATEHIDSEKKTFVRQSGRLYKLTGTALYRHHFGSCDVIV